MSIQIAGGGGSFSLSIAKVPGNYIPPAPKPEFTGILDTLALPVSFAGGVRKYYKDYAGSCIRVRRSSDNAELDIGFTTDGDLNTAALLAHTGAGDGYITTLYDQSGNVRNLVQATVGNQPAIVLAGIVVKMSAGTTRPGIRTLGATQGLGSALFGVAQPLTRSAVLEFLDITGGTQFILGSAGTSPVNQLWFSANGVLSSFANNSINFAAGLVVNSRGTTVEIHNGASSVLSYNGATTSGNVGPRAIEGAAIGTVSGMTGANVICGDLIIFPSALSAGNRVTLETNQKTYYGTP